VSTDAVPLADWESFFVIVGSSAAVLTGLMFVVITLQQENRSPNARHAIRAFGSPTLVHFTTVLLLVAVLSIPQHTRASLGLIVLITGAGLMAYLLWAFRKARQQDVYAPDLGDWIWHYCLPALAYLSMAIAGASAWSAPTTTLRILAGAILLLLVIGIHNTWDSAIWIVINRPERQDR
jgi:hypothetical protein